MSKERRKIKSEIDAQNNIIDQLNAAQAPEDKPKEEEKGTVRVTLDIPKPLHREIKAYTKARGQSIKGYLLFLASQDMKQ